MEENFENAEPLSTSSHRKDVDVESSPKEIVHTENAISKELENEPSEKSLTNSKIPSKLANIEKIFPDSNKKSRQAGAELCQAQDSLG